MRYACLFVLVACSNAEETSETSSTSSTSSTITTPTVVEGDCELQTNNALRIDCNFSHLEGTNATVTATAGTVTRSFVVGAGLTSVWGLQESTAYDVAILDSAGASLYAETITTGAIPSSLELSASTTGAGNIEAVLVQDCATSAMLVTFDSVGNIIWYQDIEDLVPGAELHGYSPTENDSIILLTGRDAIAEVAMSGELLRTISLGDYGLDGVLHHDVHTRNGTIYALYAYQLGAYVYDGVYVFDGENEYLGTIKSENFFDGQAIIDSQGGAPPDAYWEGTFSDVDSIGHGNSVYMHDNGELILSFRYLNTIVSVDGDTSSGTFGVVNWMLEGIEHDEVDGDFNLVSSVTSDLDFEAPHCAQIGPSGALTLFDNGLNINSRGVTISLDGNTADITGSYELQERCSVQSSIVETKDGDMLMACAESYNVYEFSPGESNPHWTMDVEVNCPLDGGPPPPMTPRVYPVDLH
jgi:hypothetical protein